MRGKICSDSKSKVTEMREFKAKGQYSQHANAVRLVWKMVHWLGQLEGGAILLQNSFSSGIDGNQIAV